MFNIFKFFSKEKEQENVVIKREHLSTLVKSNDDTILEKMESNKSVLSQRIKNAEMIKEFIINELNDKTDGDSFEVKVEVQEKIRDRLQDSNSQVIVHLTLPVEFQKIYYPLNKVSSFLVHAFYHDDSERVINSIANVISSIKYFYKERKLNALHT